MHNERQRNDSQLEYLKSPIKLYHQENKDSTMNINHVQELSVEIFNSIKVAINEYEYPVYSLREMIQTHDSDIEKELTHVLVEVQPEHVF